MKKGKVYRLKEGFVPDGNFQLNEGIVKRDGWLWIAEKHILEDSSMYTFRSIATGTKKNMFIDRFEEVEDEEG